MCGFSGFIGSIDNPEQKLLKSLKPLNHRGLHMLRAIYSSKKRIWVLLIIAYQ